MIDTFVKKKETAKNYPYQTFESDPLNTRIYTLDNGLKVYLSVNNEEPRIHTSLAFKAGSKHDPPETTGLAHYMEHMLFKGTSDFGTQDWAKEEALLTQIADLYEKHRNTQDAQEKLEIYKEIDRLSFEASHYAIPNEYDKMISSLGAKGTNAYTSKEKTVYLNDIPANELERFLILESNRFRKLVLRLFHTELETVYEEFNRSLDNDYVKSWNSIYEDMYPTHPYGIPILGKAEHLKNPSMYNIYEFFSAHYRPNNAALCLSGDFDPDETIKMVDKYFGAWEPKETPAFTFTPEAPIDSPRISENVGSQTEHLYLSYRFDGAHTDDFLMIQLISHLLYNSVAGLIDINLVQKQKVLSAASFASVMQDYSHHVFYGLPKQGQTLEEVKDLLLEQVEKVKEGAFEEWLIEAVVNHLKYERTRNIRKNAHRCRYMLEMFILDLDYQEATHFLDRMGAVTKEQVIEFAKKRYLNNYVCSFKRQGVDNQAPKVDKPPLTPLEINRNVDSAFHQAFKEVPSSSFKPVFLDYEKQIQRFKVSKNGQEIPFAYIKNGTDDVFQLYYILDMGSHHHDDLNLALKYLTYLGTEKYSSADIQKQTFRYGVDLKAYTRSRKAYIYLGGLEKSLEEGLELLEHVLANVQPNKEAYDKMVEGMIKQRHDQKLSKDTILHSAMYNHAVYGKESPFTDIQSEETLRAKDPQVLCDLLRSLLQYPLRMFYFGQKSQEEIATIFKKHHAFLPKENRYPERKVYVEQPTEKNQVFLVDYEQTQVEIMLIAKRGLYDAKIHAARSIFNEYFGAGLSSIVFQEVREAKALAYSAYAWYTNPSFQDKSHFINAYIGTQTDKLQEAIDVFLYLINNMPHAVRQFESAKEAALKKIESERFLYDKVFWDYENAKNRGLTEDIRKQMYEEIKKMTLDDLQAFFDQHIKGSVFNYLIIGKLDRLDKSIVEKLGEVKELSLEEIFNY